MNNDSRLFNEKYNLKVNETSFNKIDSSNKHILEMTSPKKVTKSKMKQFFGNPIAVISIIIFVAIFIASYVGVLLSDFKSNEVITSSEQNAWYAFFGVDANGYDVFTRTMNATSRTFELALLVSVSSMVFGATTGILFGLKSRNVADAVLSKTLNVYNSVPIFIWYAILMIIMPNNYWSLFGLLALTSWQKFFVIARKQTIVNLNQKYIESLQISGVSKSRIIMKHVLPNVYGHIFGQFIVTIANIIVADATLNLMFPTLINNGLTLGEIIVEGSLAAKLEISNYLWLPITITLLISLSMYLTSYNINKLFEVKNGKVVNNE